MEPSILRVGRTIHVQPVGKSFAVGYRYPEDLKTLESVVGENVLADFIQLLK